MRVRTVAALDVRERLPELALKFTSQAQLEGTLAAHELVNILLLTQYLKTIPAEARGGVVTEIPILVEDTFELMNREAQPYAVAAMERMCATVKAAADRGHELLAGV